jgi:AraC-like DNA-binding protein
MTARFTLLPLRKDRAYFTGLLERLLAAGGVRDVVAGGRIPGERRPGDQREVALPYPRLMIVAHGTQRFAFTRHGRRVDVTLKPRQAIYAPPSAWTMDFWDRDVMVLGLVFRPHFMRALVYRHHPGPAPDPTPYAYHTARPLTGPGHALLLALDSLAETRPEAAALPDLLTGLLRLSLDHLRADDPHCPGPLGRGVRTWQRVVDYLHDHYMDPINRKTVADALGLHPNYLSTLARQQTAEGFQAVLEGLRIATAQRLLRETDLKLQRLAALSGYGSASYFSTAFRRATGGSPEQYRHQLRIPQAAPVP